MRTGGDGYTVMAEKAIDPYDFGPTLNEALAQYVTARSPLAMQLEGRITRVDSAVALTATAPATTTVAAAAPTAPATKPAASATPAALPVTGAAATPWPLAATAMVVVTLVAIGIVEQRTRRRLP
jgi:5'-nucleotidase / UDP-sugar diphosphatase